jgi:hypothetical protein
LSWGLKAQQGKVIVHCCLIVLWMCVNGRDLEPFPPDRIL